MTLRARQFVLSLLGCAAFGISFGSDKVPVWTPPKTTVAKELVEAGKFLLEHGMADPRGGRFAIAKVKIKTRFLNGSGTFEKIGWVKDIAGKKTLVDLTGMAQAIDSVVREIPVAEAVKKALEVSEKGMVFGCPYNIYRGYVEGQQLTADEQLYSNLLTDEAVALLLIDGDIKEAESLFAVRGPVEYDKGKAVRTGIPEPEARYRMVERFFQRTLSVAVQKFTAKDDEGAVAATANLINNEEAYLNYMLSLGQIPHLWRDERTGELLFTRMQKQAAILHQQLLQNISEGSAKPDWTEFDKLPQKERVKRLIGLLSDVGPNLIIGSLIGFGMDPIYDRLVKEDLAAGDTLADCIKNDKRFTRTDLMRNNGCPTNGLVKVKTVAEVVLKQIVKLDGSDEYDRQPDGDAKLIAYWNEVKHMTPMERWMKVLRNDKAQPMQWIYASQWLLKPEDDPTPIGQVQDSWRPRPPARFQALSESQKSEIADLLLMRAKQVKEGKSGEPTETVYASSHRLELAISAYKINRSKAAPDLKELVAAAYGNRNLVKQGMYGATANLAKGLGLLIEAKDQFAAKTYLAWLKEPITDAVYSPELFVPLLYLPPAQGDNAVKDLLTDPKSAMYINPDDSKQQSSLVKTMARSPLLLFPSFRSLYAMLMADTTMVGPIKVVEKVLINGIYPNQGPLSVYSDQIDPNDLPDAKNAVCRVCDEYASQIAFKGAPEFKIYWSTKRKDEAIQELISYLNEHYADIASEAQRYRPWRL